jgi:hypothetical protein
MNKANRESNSVKDAPPKAVCRHAAAGSASACQVDGGQDGRLRMGIAARPLPALVTVLELAQEQLKKGRHQRADTVNDKYEKLGEKRGSFSGTACSGGRRVSNSGSSGMSKEPGGFSEVLYHPVMKSSLLRDERRSPATRSEQLTCLFERVNAQCSHAAAPRSSPLASGGPRAQLMSADEMKSLEASISMSRSGGTSEPKAAVDPPAVVELAMGQAQLRSSMSLESSVATPTLKHEPQLRHVFRSIEGQDVAVCMRRPSSNTGSVTSTPGDGPEASEQQTADGMSMPVNLGHEDKAEWRRDCQDEMRGKQPLTEGSQAAQRGGEGPRCLESHTPDLAMSWYQQLRSVQRAQLADSPGRKRSGRLALGASSPRDGEQGSNTSAQRTSRHKFQAVALQKIEDSSGDACSALQPRLASTLRHSWREGPLGLAVSAATPAQKNGSYCVSEHATHTCMQEQAPYTSPVANNTAATGCTRAHVAPHAQLGPVAAEGGDLGAAAAGGLPESSNVHGHNSGARNGPSSADSFSETFQKLLSGTLPLRAAPQEASSSSLSSLGHGSSVGAAFGVGGDSAEACLLANPMDSLAKTGRPSTSGGAPWSVLMPRASRCAPVIACSLS